MGLLGDGFGSTEDVERNSEFVMHVSSMSVYVATMFQY